jgi:hypothetical protein
LLFLLSSFTFFIFLECFEEEIPFDNPPNPLEEDFVKLPLAFVNTLLVLALATNGVVADCLKLLLSESDDSEELCELEDSDELESSSLSSDLFLFFFLSLSLSFFFLFFLESLLSDSDSLLLFFSFDSPVLLDSSF